MLLSKPSPRSFSFIGYPGGVVGSWKVHSCHRSQKNWVEKLTFQGYVAPFGPCQTPPTPVRCWQIFTAARLVKGGNFMFCFPFPTLLESILHFTHSQRANRMSLQQECCACCNHTIVRCAVLYSVRFVSWCILFNPTRLRSCTCASHGQDVENTLCSISHFFRRV